RPEERISWVRSILYALLLLIAVSTKEHTLTLPLLLLGVCWFWNPGSIRKNVVFFGLQALAGVAGGVLVLRVLMASNSAGFNVAGVGPAAYLFTQFRVIWDYIRLLFLPVGQNVDPDVELSSNLLQHGSFVGLVVLAALLGAAWFWRKR